MDTRTALAWATVAAMVLGAVLLVWAQESVRPVEARVSAAVVGGTRVADARSIGTAVVFPLRGGFVGYSLTEGCTAALLVSPFCLLAAGLVAARRTTVQRGLTTLAGLAIALFAVNQARLLVVALSMRVWGFRQGYEISHVMLGTIVSTLGVLVGLLVFIRFAISAKPLRVTHG